MAIDRQASFIRDKVRISFVILPEAYRMMLFEYQVIDAVCEYLERHGFRIEQRLSGAEHGDDIIAVCKGEPQYRLFVEAKGATSSRKGSRRYGEPFTRAQVRNHIAMAFYKAAEIQTREKGRHRVLVGIALPQNGDHLDLLDGIRAGIEELWGSSSSG